MSISTPAVQVHEVAAQPSLPRHAGWLLVAAAVLASVLLFSMTVVSSNDVADTPGVSTFDPDRGGITAIDHGAQTPPVLQGSITAIDHRSESGD